MRIAVHTTAITIPTQRNSIVENAFRMFFFLLMNNKKTLTANQNPPNFKEIENLKQQTA